MTREDWFTIMFGLAKILAMALPAVFFAIVLGITPCPEPESDDPNNEQVESMDTGETPNG